MLIFIKVQKDNISNMILYKIMIVIIIICKPTTTATQAMCYRERNGLTIPVVGTCVWCFSAARVGVWCNIVYKAESFGISPS